MGRCQSSVGLKVDADGSPQSYDYQLELQSTNDYLSSASNVGLASEKQSVQFIQSRVNDTVHLYGTVPFS